MTATALWEMASSVVWGSYVFIEPAAYRDSGIYETTRLIFLFLGCDQAPPGPALGNYVTAGVGNYVKDNPSDLGNCVTADTAGNGSRGCRCPRNLRPEDKWLVMPT